jgi:hypothetical protein
LFYDRVVPLDDLKKGEIDFEEQNNIAGVFTEVSKCVDDFSLSKPPLSREEERSLISHNILEKIKIENYELINDSHIYNLTYLNKIGELMDSVGWYNKNELWKTFESVVKPKLISTLKVKQLNSLLSDPLSLSYKCPFISHYDLINTTLLTSNNPCTTISSFFVDVPSTSPPIITHVPSVIHMLLFRTWISFLFDTCIHCNKKPLFFFWTRNTEVDF